MRPSDPLPAIWFRSRLVPFAMRRTKGDERTLRSSLLVTGTAGTDAAFSGAATVAVFVGFEPATGAAAEPPITATTVLTSTVAPSGLRISVSSPATGAG